MKIATADWGTDTSPASQEFFTKQFVHTFSLWAFVYSEIVMILATIYAVIAYRNVMRHSKFKWVQKMILLCVLSNFTTVVFLVVDREELKPFNKKFPILEASLFAIFIFLWYSL